MIERISGELTVQAEALRLRAHRQEALASNIANADTPGYRALDFDFRRALADAVRRPGGASGTRPALREQTPAQPAADGNGVDMDVERAKFADNAVRYEAALRTLNLQIRTLTDAIKG